MDPKLTKRIMSDISQLNDSNLRLEGIYWSINNDNIRELKIMIIGPNGAPYEGGFFFFNLEIPLDYPFNPPIMKFMTTHNNMRFNPNLYVHGKVCLSILNTWTGPSWTPCYTILSVLISLVGMVFIADPLRNEPSKERESQEIVDEYSKIVEHETLDGAFLKVLEEGAFSEKAQTKTSLEGNNEFFKIFREDIISYFEKNIDRYNERMQKLMNEKNVVLTCCYRCNIQTKYDQLYQKFKKIEEYYLKK